MSENMSKILLISPKFPPPFIGGSRNWIYTNVIESAFRGDIDVLTARKTLAERFIGTTLSIIGSSSIWDGKDDTSPTYYERLAMLSAIIYYIFKNRKSYSTILCNAFDFNNSVIFIVARILKINTIGVGYGEEYTILKNRLGVPGFLRRILVRCSHRYPVAFIVVSKFTADQLRYFGVAKTKLHTIPPKSLHLEGSGISRHSLDASTPVKLLSVGRLVERKGFGDLISAVKGLQESGLNVTLKIIGQGPLLASLTDRIRALGLEEMVEIANDVDDEELRESYKTADIFVLANRMLHNGDTEGSPVVFSEAASYGLPIIGGVNCGSDVAIEHNVNGYRINSEDASELKGALIRLCSDCNLRLEMGRKSLELARLKLHPRLLQRKFDSVLESIHLESRA